MMVNDDEQPALLAHLNKFPNSTNVKQQVEDLLFKNNVPSSFDTPQFRSRILRGLEWSALPLSFSLLLFHHKQSRY